MVGKMDFQVVPFFWIGRWIGGVYQLGVWALGGGVVVASWLFRAAKEQDVDMGCWDRGVETV